MTSNSGCNEISFTFTYFSSIYFCMTWLWTFKVVEEKQISLVNYHTHYNYHTRLVDGGWHYTHVNVILSKFVAQQKFSGIKGIKMGTHGVSQWVIVSLQRSGSRRGEEWGHFPTSILSSLPSAPSRGPPSDMWDNHLRQQICHIFLPQCLTHFALSQIQAKLISAQ